MDGLSWVEKTEEYYLVKTVSQCHFFHHGSHMDRSGVTVRRQSSWTMARPTC